MKNNELPKSIQLNESFISYKKGYKPVQGIQISNNSFLNGKLTTEYQYPGAKNVDRLVINLIFWKKGKIQILIAKAVFYSKEYARTGIQITKDLYKEDVSDIYIPKDLVDDRENVEVFWNFIEDLSNYYQNPKILESIRKEILKEYEQRTNY